MLPSSALKVLGAKAVEVLGHDVILYNRALIHNGHVTPEGTGVISILVGLIFCALSYKLSRHYTPLYFKGYKQLSLHDQRDWDTRLANISFSIYIAATSCYWMLVDDFFYKEGPVGAMFRYNHETYSALGFAVGFFVVDLATTLKYWMGGTPMVLHHVGSLLAVGIGAVTGTGHQMTLWMLSTEATTPFISLRFLLDKAGLKRHPAYLANGLVIVFMWTFTRLLTFPVFYYVVYTQRHMIPQLNPASKYLLYIFPAVLLTLNTWWYLKIVKGAWKAYKDSGKPLPPPKATKAE